MSLASRLAWIRRSSTLRLALALSILFALCMAVAVFVALSLGSGALERRTDLTLRAIAGASELDGERGDRFGIILRAADDLADLPRPFRTVTEAGGGTIDLEQDFRQAEAWRVLVLTDSEGSPVVAAMALDDGEDALEVLGGIFWTTVLLVVGLTLLVGFLAGLIAQRRLRRINGALTALAAGNLSARTGITRNKDDLDDIARQVDVTGGELERLVAQTRHLSASLAHDLRTPLARLRSRLESLPAGEERGAALEEAERLTGIFDTIMRVARIEAAQGTDGFEQIDLADLMEDLADTFGPVVEDEGKLLIVDVSAPGTVFGDRQMLVQAIANLIQNAIRHGGNEITLLAHGQSIGVQDDGIGVDPMQYSEIVKPMVRLDTARKSEGTGLGLALVRAVADRHGAELALSQVQPKGLAVRLNFADL